MMHPFFHTPAMSSVHPFKVLASRLEREPLWRSELLDTDLDLKSSSKVGEFLLHAFPDLRLRSSLSNFKSWFNRFSRNYPLTYAAILQAAVIRYQRNCAKRSLVSCLLLNPNAPSTKSAIRTLWESIPVYVVSRLSAPYPPKGFWIVDHDPIWDLWYNHLQYGKQPDARIARRPMMRVDSTALQFDLGPEESGRFNESDGTPVMMVMRNFCSLVEIVSWVNDIVLRNVACQRNVRVCAHHSNRPFLFLMFFSSLRRRMLAVLSYVDGLLVQDLNLLLISFATF